VEDGTSIEVDKVIEVLIDGTWYSVTPGTFLMVPFELDPSHEAVPGIGFRTGPATSSRNREAIYAPLSFVSAVKTVDDARTAL
jgi:hypothetical protein